MSTPVWNPKTGKQFLLNDADVAAWTKAGYVLQMPGAPEAKPSAAPAQPAPQPIPGIGQTIRDKALQGFTTNGDELDGALRVAYGAIADKYHELTTGKSVPSTAAQDYTAGRDDARSRLAAESKEHPRLSKAAEFAGNLPATAIALKGGVPGMAAYGASQGVGRAEHLDGSAVAGAGKEAVVQAALGKAAPIVGKVASKTVGPIADAASTRVADFLGKWAPAIAMKKYALTPEKLGVKDVPEALKWLGDRFKSNPELMKARNPSEFLKAAEVGRDDAWNAIKEAYAARGGAPVATRHQLYAELEKALESVPESRDKVLNNVARIADPQHFVDGVKLGMDKYGHSPAEASQFSRELIQGNHSPMTAMETHEWLQQLKKATNPSRDIEMMTEHAAPGQTAAAKTGYGNAKAFFNEHLDDASRQARGQYADPRLLKELAEKPAGQELPGSIIPRGATLLQKGENALHSGEAGIMGQTQRTLRAPSTLPGVAAAATPQALPVAAQHFAGMAKSLGLLDIPDATDKAARDLLLQERHSDYSEARRAAAKEHDQHQAGLDQQAEKAK